MSTTINVNNAAIYWSPYNVYVNGSSYALMLVPGAYFKLGFTGTSMQVNIDVSPLTGASVAAGQYPEIRYQVDGGAWTVVQLTSSTTNVLVSGLSAGSHTFRFEVAAFTIGSPSVDRWVTPVTAIKITSLTIDTAASVSAPTIASKVLRVDGDSITEGDYALGGTDVTGNAAYASYAYKLATTLGTELTLCPCGGQGWISGGQGGTPAWVNAFSQYYQQVSRIGPSFTSSAYSPGVLANPPDYWINNQGTNDGANSYTIYQALVEMRRQAGGKCIIFVLIPFNGSNYNSITDAYNAYRKQFPTDLNIYLIDLGPLGEATYDGTHPTDAGHTTIATALNNAIGGIISAGPISTNTVLIIPPQCSAGVKGMPMQNLSLVPAGSLSSTVTLTSGGYGSWSPGSLTWSATANAQTLAYTPTNSISSHIIGVASGAPAFQPAINAPTGVFCIDSSNIFVKDTFTDTAGTAITSHTGETGATWASYRGAGTGFQIDSKGMLRAASGTPSIYASGTPASADYDIEWDVAVYDTSVGGYVQVFARASQSASTYYVVWYQVSTGSVFVYRVVNGAGTQIGSTVTTSPPVPGSVQHFKFSLRGPSLNVFLNGNQLYSLVDRNITAAGNVGISFTNSAADGTNAVINNFVAYNVPSAVYTVTGPTVCSSNQASGPFTVTLSRATFGNCNVMVSDTGAGGTFVSNTPQGGSLSGTGMLSMIPAAGTTSFTFQYIPKANTAGPVTLTFTNNQNWPDQTPLTLNVLAPRPAIGGRVFSMA